MSITLTNPLVGSGPAVITAVGNNTAARLVTRADFWIGNYASGDVCLNAAIAALPATGGKVYAAGEFDLKASVVSDKPATIIEGAGTSIGQVSGSGPGVGTRFYMSSTGTASLASRALLEMGMGATTSNMQLRNLTIDGNYQSAGGVATTQTDGVWMAGLNSLMSNVEVLRMNGHGAVHGNATAARAATNWRIELCLFHHNRGSGFTNIANATDGHNICPYVYCNGDSTVGPPIFDAVTAGVPHATMTVTAITTGAAPQITSTAHGLAAGDVVTFSGTNSTPALTGPYKVASIVGANDITITGVTVTVSGSAGTMQLNSSGHGVRLATGAAGTQSLGGEYYGNSGYGYYDEAGTNMYIGVRIENNRGGIYLGSAGHFTLTGVQFRGNGGNANQGNPNGIDESGRWDNLFIDGTGITVTGGSNIANTKPSTNAQNQARFGVFANATGHIVGVENHRFGLFGSGGSPSPAWTTNAKTGTVAGEVGYNAAGTATAGPPTQANIQYSHCPNYTTVARGAYSATPGAVATVTIAHGLGSTQAPIIPNSFQMHPTNAAARDLLLSSATTRPWYWSADATNVTLTFSAALTAATAYAFSWRAARE